MFKGEIIPHVNPMSEEAETHDSFKQKESIVHSTTATTVYRGSSINNNVHNYFSSHVSYAEWLHLCESISNSRKVDHFLLDTIDSCLQSRNNRVLFGVSIDKNLRNVILYQHVSDKAHENICMCIPTEEDTLEGLSGEKEIVSDPAKDINVLLGDYNHLYNITRVCATKKVMPPELRRKYILSDVPEAQGKLVKRTRRSHTGVSIHISSGPIIWSSRRQNTVELSIESLKYRFKMMSVRKTHKYRIGIHTEVKQALQFDLDTSRYYW